MNELGGADILRIARAVARRYKKKCWWANLEDMISEASVAILESRSNWDPQVGIPIEGYVARAAALRIRDFLWRQSSPVSGGLHNPRELIAGVHAAPLEEDLALREESVEVLHDRISWRLRVRDQIRRLASITRDGDLAVEVMVHEEKTTSDLKRETGRDVYGAVHLVRRKARYDATLYKLWRRGCP